MSLRSIISTALFCAVSATQAAPISWNTWTTGSAGTIATANGPIGVGFAGQSFNVFNAYPSYTPASTWADGSVVNNAPVAANGILQLIGGNSNVQTINFSSAVVDPVMAIWSLGQPTIEASFVFQGITPVFVKGGPSAEYGGSSIVVNGNTVSGHEGNGTVQFLGTFNSISWTNPLAENWYGFNVGIAGVAAVPEPATYWLILAGFGVMGALRARRRG